MNVSLTRELEQFIARKLASGSYRNASEVIREGLRMLRENEKSRKNALQKIRRQILIGIQQADNGKTSPFNDETVRRIKSRGRQRRHSNGISGE
jgi:antitoxin ParD1/3/4